jgi:hypothetical protein
LFLGLAVWHDVSGPADIIGRWERDEMESRTVPQYCTVPACVEQNPSRQLSRGRIATKLPLWQGGRAICLMEECDGEECKGTKVNDMIDPRESNQSGLDAKKLLYIRLEMK